MAKTQKASSELEAEAKELETPAAPPKFAIERLRRECLSLFDVTVSTFDGATFGLKGEYSVEEMRVHIKKWQNMRVEPVKKTKKEVN